MSLWISLATAATGYSLIHSALAAMPQDLHFTVSDMHCVDYFIDRGQSD